jgi:hypothetical protein
VLEKDNPLLLEKENSKKARTEATSSYEKKRKVSDNNNNRLCSETLNNYCQNAFSYVQPLKKRAKKASKNEEFGDDAHDIDDDYHSTNSHLLPVSKFQRPTKRNQHDHSGELATLLLEKKNLDIATLRAEINKKVLHVEELNLRKELDLQRAEAELELEKKEMNQKLKLKVLQVTSYSL